MRKPYVQDPLTGKSATRKWLEAYLDMFFSPTEDGRSIYDTIYGMTVPPEPPIYKQKAKDSTLTYIGRASRLLNGSNRHEKLWCEMLDVKDACERLDRRTRIVLGLKYAADLDEYTIADRLGLTWRQVFLIVHNGLEAIVKHLDREQ